MAGDDHPLWYSETEDDVPPGPILLAAAIAYAAAADACLFPGRLLDAAARILATGRTVSRTRAEPRDEAP